MRVRSGSKKKRGVSPVISTIILSAVVMAVGGSLLSFASGASTVFANDYINSTFVQVEDILESFIVEHVSYNDTDNVLHIWIFSCGMNGPRGNITIKAQIYIGDNIVTDPDNSVELDSYEHKQVAIPYNATAGDELIIKIHSWRGKNAYYTYIVP